MTEGNEAGVLEPCPFCGNTKIKVHEKRRGNYRREGDNYQAWCSKCRARGPLVMDNAAQAAAAWDTRTPSGFGPERMAWLDLEFCDGYRDGRDRLSPEPSDNRSAAYRHSFAVGRAELAGCPIPASISRERADKIRQSERTGA